MDISPGKLLPVILQNSDEADATRADTYLPLLQRLGRVESIAVLKDDQEPPAAATALLGDLRLLVPMKGIIDVDAERGRLEKRIQRVKTDLERTRGKLDNENFVNNAPSDVVTKEQQRAVEFANTISQLTEQLEKLAELT